MCYDSIIVMWIAGMGMRTEKFCRGGDEIMGTGWVWGKCMGMGWERENMMGWR